MYAPTDTTSTQHIKTPHTNMNIRTTLLILIAVLGASSCGDTRGIRETFSMHFQPRECSQIITLPLRYKEIPGTAGNKHFVTKTTEMLEDGAVEADRFILWMMTGEDDLKELRAEYPNLKSKEYENVYEKYHTMKGRVLKAPHMRPLEQQLEHDYRSYIFSTRALSTSGDAKATAYPRPWPYRVTGVKDFRIISLSPLFGQPAESSLNDYFIIDEFSPRQIISYRRKALLWGYSDKDKVTSIRQWLSMEPMAPPVVMFRLKRRPEELPIKTKLVSILETTEGKVLRDTLEVELK